MPPDEISAPRGASPEKRGVDGVGFGEGVGPGICELDPIVTKVLGMLGVVVVSGRSGDPGVMLNVIVCLAE